MNDSEEFLDYNKDIIANFKKGDLFKLGFISRASNYWIEISCYFFMNSNNRWHINRSCGCDTNTRILKPTMEDYIKMTSILKGNKTILNRKRLLTKGEDINFTNEYGASMFKKI